MSINQIGYADRNELIRELKLRLADNIVDVELDREHYDVAIDLALAKYRQLSSGSVEESYMFLLTNDGTSEYVLPNEVMEVQKIYRRGVGTNSGSGSNFDPFDVAFNNMYLLNAGQVGGIATFDFFSQYKELIDRVFGGQYAFTWNHITKTLKILRNVAIEEEILLHTHNFRPEQVLLRDVYASNWLASYSLAQSKKMLGEARSKYQSGLPGAGGGIILNGEQLKSEATEEIEQLLDDIRNFREGNRPLGFVIG